MTIEQFVKTKCSTCLVERNTIVIRCCVEKTNENEGLILCIHFFVLLEYQLQLYKLIDQRKCYKTTHISIHITCQDSLLLIQKFRCKTKYMFLKSQNLPFEIIILRKTERLKIWNSIVNLVDLKCTIFSLTTETPFQFDELSEKWYLWIINFELDHTFCMYHVLIMNFESHSITFYAFIKCLAEICK